MTRVLVDELAELLAEASAVEARQKEAVEALRAAVGDHPGGVLYGDRYALRARWLNGVTIHRRDGLLEQLEHANVRGVLQLSSARLARALTLDDEAAAALHDWATAFPYLAFSRHR